MKPVEAVLRAGVGFAALAAGSVAGAQGAPAPVASVSSGDIVITGSRIRRDPLNQNAPVVFVDKAAIDKTGLSAVGDVLQRIPSAAGGLNTKVNASGNLGNPPDGGGVGAGSATIDLRYLGTNRTLVLVDGLRFVNGTSASGIPGAVDLNTIPINMIERVEVLQAGASPLYGSDAIAGVVNVITVEHQEGLRASAQYGRFGQGDGHTQDYQASYGMQGARSSLVFGVAYAKQGPVYSRDRSISQFPNPGQTACTDPIGGCSSAAVNGRFDTRTGAGPIAGVPFGNFTISNPPDSTPTLAELRGFTAADRFNFAPFNYILTPSTRYGGWVTFKTEFSDTVNFRVKALYNHRSSENKAAFEPLFIGPDAGNGAGSLFDTLSIDVTNPYNPFGVTLQSGSNPDGSSNGQTQNYSFIGRRLVEAGQRDFHQKVNTYSATATLDGKFNIGSHEWYWDTSGVVGFNEANQTFTGNVRADRVAQAVGPIANCTAPCVPLNLFGGNGSITPAMLDWIGFTEKDSSSQDLWDYTANMSGPIADLPAGPLQVAFGYEHRYQSAHFTPDPIVSAGLGADIPAHPAKGHYHVDELYGEVRIPIVKDVPGIYSLEANGALRHSRYSTSGGSTTYTINGLWKPFHDLLIRGSYSTGFRAPTLGELYGGRSRFDLPVTDPCTSDPSGQFQTNATVRANCIAHGVPASGSYAEPPGQLPVITQGNLALKPEKSKNLNFGAVFSHALSGFGSFSIEGDYHDIKVNNAISGLDPNLTLINCAFQGIGCNLIVRTRNGFINEIDATLQNLDSIHTRSIDTSLSYRSPGTSVGRFGLTANGSWLLKYQLVESNGFLIINRRGTERGSPDQAYPKFKGNMTLDWSLDAWSASLTGRYIDKVTEINPFTGLPNTLHSRFYVDGQLNWTPPVLNNSLMLTLGANNLTDRDPPACFTCSLNNYDPTTYDVPGRFFYGRITYKLGSRPQVVPVYTPPPAPPPPPVAEPAPPPPPPPAPPAPERGN